MFGFSRAKRRAARLAIVGLLGALFAALPTAYMSQPSEASTALYEFTDHEFTNCGKTGPEGPSTANCTDSYSTTWDSTSSLFSVSGGVQQWKVPVTGRYEITVVGAHGAASTGASNTRGGRGAVIQVERELQAGDTAHILVGQAGTGNVGNGGGGGASFFNLNSRTSETNLVVAGGGGGTRTDATSNGGNANTDQDGLSPSAHSIGNPTVFSANTSNVPGYTSAGGQSSATLGSGGLAAESNFGDGGAGWNGNGFDDGVDSTRAIALNKTAVGGGTGDPTDAGGFGGGGSGKGARGGGGGGGYTGGNGAWVAGGGGSFIASSFTEISKTIDESRSFDRGGTAVHGYVTVTLLEGPPANIVVSDTGSFTSGQFSGGIWVTSDPTSTARISTSTLEAQLQSGNTILRATSGFVSIEGDVSVSPTVIRSLTLEAGTNISVTSTGRIDLGNASTVTMKATGNISVASAQILTNGGTVTMQADSDANGSGAISLDTAIVLTRGGGIVLSGGTDTDTGYAIGSVGVAVSVSIIDAGGGALVIRGKSNRTSGSEGYGVHADSSQLIGNSLSIVGAGSIQPAIASNNHHGVYLDSTVLSPGSGTTTITGTGSLTTAAGASSSGVVMSSVSLTGQTGDVNITGTGSLNTGGGHHGVSLSVVTLAASGALSIEGRAVTNNSSENAGVVIDSVAFECNFSSYSIKGQDTVSNRRNGILSGPMMVGCDDSNAPISILADGIKTSTSPSIILATQGAINVETFGNSALNTGPLLFGDAASSIQIGNGSKNSAIQVASNISTSGNVSVFGSTVELFAGISSSGKVTLKSTDASYLQSGSSIFTNGGDVLIWSNANNYYSYGAIGLQGAEITTNGGDLVMAGGADTNGTPDGHALTQGGQPKFEKGAISILGGTEIRTSGGDLLARGKNGVGSAAGIFFEGDVLVDVGAGKVDLEGLTSANPSSAYGIRFSPTSATGQRATVISSSNAAADSIVMVGSLQGVTTSTLGAGIGSKAEDQNNDVDFAVSINTLGGISLSGVASSAGGRGLELSSMELVSGAAGITLTGTGSGQNGTDTFGIEGSAIASRSSVIETAGTLELRADSFDISTIDIDANSLVIEPTGTSFVANGSFDPLTGNLKSDLDDLRIGKSGNLTAISISQAVTASGDIVLFGGNVGSSADLSAAGLAVASTGTVLFTGDNDFDTVDVSSSKGDLADGDIAISDADGWVSGDVSADVAGQYGKPRYLEFVTLPSNPIEESAFEVSAKVGRDHYGLAMAQENLSPSTFTITKATGAGVLSGAAAQTAVGGQSVSFSNLVLTEISQDGATLSFTISGSVLDPTTSGEVFFIGLPSTDSRLSGLVTSQGALTPSFDIDTRQYSITVPNGTGSLTLTPTANDQFHSGIEVNGNTVTSGAASAAIGLVTGNNVVSVVVTAEDGSTSSYVINVFRQLSQQVDWVYGDVSITEPDGSVSTASAFTDMYGDTSRNSALSDDVTLDEDGLPQKTITLKVGEVLHLPMTSNHGNAMGYGGITGVENQICKINGFKKTPGSQSGHYTITALRAGACDGVFVSVHQRNTMTMLSLGARGIDLGSGYFRTPHVKIVVERKDQTQAAIFNGTDQAISAAAWNEPQTLEIRTTEQMPFGNKSFTHISGPCTVTTKPVVIGGVSYYFMATAEVVATGAGTCVIEGAQAQDEIYNAKTWSHTITFGPATQTLAFTSNVPAEPIVGSSYSPAVTSSAMLAVTLGVTTGNGTVCTINGSGDVSFIATGSCTIQATGVSNANYQAPTPITQTLVVGTANQSITFNQIPDKEIGDTAFRAMANATSGLVVSFTTVTSNTICTVSTAGLVTIVGEGQCSVTANQAGNSQVGAAQSVTRVFTIRPEGSSAPFITAVSYGDGSLTATLIAPSYTGGNSILDYSLFAYNANNQNVALVTGCDASATPVQCTVTGLTNGQPYTLKAAARTSAGLGSLSGPSQAVTPLANPQAVNGLTALAGNQTLTITWQPPSSLGGGDFARFDIRIRPAGGNFPGLSAPSATISAITESSYVFTGLQNGVSYDVEMITITTEPASGMNAATLQSHTARVLQTPFTRPNAPRNLAAFEVDNAVKIAFAYPDFDGGRQVDEYRVSVNGTTVCTPTQVQVCSVPMATLTSLMSSPFVGGIGFQQQPGSLGFLSTTTTQIPIEVVAVNDGGTSDPATTTYNLVTGSSTPPPSSGGTGVVGAITNLPTITSYSKQVLQSTGDSFTITGTNFALISEIWAADTKLSFLRTSNDVIRITTPELPLGPHSLVLRGSFGVVTVQDAVNVIEGRIVGESTRITRTFVDGFTGRSTYLGPTNVAKLRSFVAGVKTGTVIKCYGSIPDRAKMDNIKLAFKRADRVCDFVQSLNPNIEVVRTWVWKDGNEAWDRSQVRLTLFEY